MKKLASVLCAAMLMLALPTFAWAAPSPSNQTTATDTNNGTALTVQAPGAPEGSSLTVEAIGGKASNYEPPTSGKSDVLVSTFEIKAEGGIDPSNVKVDVTFSVGTKYSGMIARVFIQHEIGDPETRTLTVSADGTVSFTMDRLSVVTIAIEEGQTPASSSASTVDKGSTSPQTGVDFTGVAGATAVMVVAAGGVAVALRKKVTE